ncbi:MAG TPA: hypothetical protein VK858_21675 [Longimicrobiales bacterium]|nr:hypothetical protein [Longimicrobiales bacterium]
MSAKGIPKLKILVEGGVIVVSILLAFGIDAWWDGRIERKQEREVLAAIEADFRDHLDVLASAREHNEERFAEARLLLEVTGPDASSIPGEVRQVFADFDSYRPVRLRGGALEALVGADGIGIISSLELRAALSEWTQAKVRLAERNLYLERQASALSDYLRTRIPVGRDAIGAGPSRFGGGLDDLARDLEFENLVAYRGGASELILHDIEVLEEIAERVLSLVATGDNPQGMATAMTTTTGEQRT